MSKSTCKLVRILLYSSSMYLFYWAYSYMFTHAPVLTMMYGGHLRFLTILSLGLSFYTLAAGLAGALVNSTRLTNLKNFLNTLAAPLECLVALLYWTLKVYDPALLVNDPRIPFIPVSVDLTMHVLPAVVLVLDLFMSDKWRESSIQKLPQYAAVVLGYYVWTEHAYAVNKVYPYPIFEVIGASGRPILFAVGGGMLLGLHTLLRRARAAV